MITLNTLIAVLVANGQQDLVTKALLVDTNNNNLEYEVGDRLIVQVDKQHAIKHLPEGHMFKDPNQHRYAISCPIVKINPLALRVMYGVDVSGFDEKPVIQWVSEEYSTVESPMILTPEAEASFAKVKAIIGTPIA